MNVPRKRRYPTTPIDVRSTIKPWEPTVMVTFDTSRVAQALAALRAEMQSGPFHPPTSNRYRSIT